MAAAPLARGPLSLRVGLDQDEVLVGDPNPRFLVVEVAAGEGSGKRQPVHLAVVIDESGSMWGDGKHEAAQAAARAIVEQVGPEDTLSVVRFSDSAQVVIAQGHVTDRPAALARIALLRPDGGTDISAGMKAGLQQLASLEAVGTRRMIVLSDGLANGGITDAPGLARLAGSRRDLGVATSAFGLGYEFDERLLTAISDGGGGRYRYVNQSDQLSRLFEEEAGQAASVAAGLVEVEVELGLGVGVDRVYGYEEYDGQRTANGFRALLGDVHEG